MTIKGYEILAQSLKRQGVDTMFFLMGGPMQSSEDACAQAGIRAIDVRHEQAAAMMAHGYARVRNFPGFCMAASGPGTLNLGTGLGNALVDCTPVVAMGGSCSSQEIGNGTFQEFDQVAAMRPLTKWAERINETRRIPELVNKAFQTASSGKPGPVYLDIPGDVVHGEIDESTVAWPDYDRDRQQARAGADPVMVDRAIAMLAAAKKPILVWGSGAAIWSGASSALKAFVDQTGIPFYATPQGRGAVAEDHEYCYLTARNVAFKEADLVMIVGTRVNYVLWHMRSPRFNANAKFIRIDIDPAEIATTPRLDIGLVGDARRVVEQFNEANNHRIRPEMFDAWRRYLSEAHQQRSQAQVVKLANDQIPIHPLRLCKEIRDFMDRDAIMVVDGREILEYGRVSIPTFLPGHRLNSGTFGTMGVGLPYALGAKAASPNSQVICLHGDGSFGINGMELDTAARHGLPVITIISLNGGWTADGQRKRTGSHLGYTRYEKMAEVFGCHGEYVDKPQDIRPALERASAATKKGVPAVINVRTDENARANAGRFSRYMT